MSAEQRNGVTLQALASKVHQNIRRRSVMPLNA